MMNPPSVSVIIPSYNYADHIANCINSVLAQTYTDFEIIVVDDGSQDNTAEVVQAFSDPRIKYIYQENKGLPGARNTAIKASKGNYLALLDSDDKYHPEKLAVQVQMLERNPELGLTYSSRLYVDANYEPIFYGSAPNEVKINDLLQYYPFSPSDVVMRREWAEKVDLYDESFILNSEDLNFHLRLALAGCKMAGTKQALTCRQIHTNRYFKNISGKMATYFRALDTAFNSEGIESDVLALKDKAYASHYLDWGWHAAAQGEADLAHEYLLKAIELDPAKHDKEGIEVFKFFIYKSILDGTDPEEMLTTAIDNLPAELAHLKSKKQEALARAYLINGTIHLMWNRKSQADESFLRAKKLGATLAPSYLGLLAKFFDDLEEQKGEKQREEFMEQIINQLAVFAPKQKMRRIRGEYFISNAFKASAQNRYQKVRSFVVKGVMHDPSIALNRGVISIFLRSLVG